MTSLPMTVEITQASLWKAVSAEFFSVFILVFCGVNCLDSSMQLTPEPRLTQTTTPPVLTVGLCFAFLTFALVCIFGDVSGGYFNPAVTWAMMFTRQISPVHACFYMMAQTAGTICAAHVIMVVQDIEPEHLLGYDAFTNTDVVTGVINATVFSALLVFVYLRVHDRSTKSTTVCALAISTLVGIVEMLGVPLTGCSGINPARSLGMAIVSQVSFAKSQVWYFILTPILGAMISSLVYPILFTEFQLEVNHGEAHPLIMHDDHHDFHIPYPDKTSKV